MLSPPPPNKSPHKIRPPNGVFNTLEFFLSRSPEAIIKRTRYKIERLEDEIKSVENEIEKLSRSLPQSSYKDYYHRSIKALGKKAEKLVLSKNPFKWMILRGWRLFNAEIRLFSRDIKRLKGNVKNAKQDFRKNISIKNKINEKKGRIAQLNAQIAEKKQVLENVSINPDLEIIAEKEKILEARLKEKSVQQKQNHETETHHNVADNEKEKREFEEKLQKMKLEQLKLKKEIEELRLHAIKKGDDQISEMIDGIKEA